MDRSELNPYQAPLEIANELERDDVEVEPESSSIGHFGFTGIAIGALVTGGIGAWVAKDTAPYGGFAIRATIGLTHCWMYLGHERL